jgi:ABC-type nitrate/sulfonate/bicarbonate transport system substrate-binding protein
MKRIITTSTIISVALAAIVSGSAVVGQDEAEPATIRMALPAFQDSLVVSAADTLGYLADEGLSVDITRTDFQGAQDLLVGGQVDMAYSTESDIIKQNAAGTPTTLIVPVTLFAGVAMMYDPEKHPDWKTFDEFTAEGMSDAEATRAVFDQLIADDAKLGLSLAGGQHGTLLTMLSIAGLEESDLNIVDLADEDQPPALLSGSIDLISSGVPQRLAVAAEGAKALIDQTDLPETLIHAHYSAQRPWVEENRDVVVRFYRAILRTLAEAETNPDPVFTAITDSMRESGTELSVEDLKKVWNVIQFFPSSVDSVRTDIAAEDGKWYWKGRLQRVLDEFTAAGVIDPVDVPIEYMYWLVDPDLLSAVEAGS